MATPEVLTKFDPMAMVQPKTRADIDVLLNEALIEAETVNQLFKKLGDELSTAAKRLKGE